MGLQQGEVIYKRYRIVKLLAQGGFGTLYRAWDTALGRPCALKENLDPSPEGQRQFLREAKILANLIHPSLPRVTDYFLVQGQNQYLVMDYVEGQDLQEMLEDRGGPLPEARVQVWAAQVCDALVYLHSQTPPVIHRDIKPANIKITPSGQAVLVDFGIAKVYDPKLKTTLGAQAVSPGYSPYEQYGKGKTDPRTDIYALGATLYTLLTAREPPESVQRVVNDPLVPPRQLNLGLSLRTSAAIMKAMQMDPSQRFPNAADFKAALAPTPVIRQPPVRVINPQPGSQAAKPAPALAPPVSLPWGWIGLVIGMSLIILFLLVQMMRGRPGAALPSGLATQSPASMHSTSPVAEYSASLTPSQPISAVVTGTLEPVVTPLVYIVQAGDTCSEIAVAFGVSIKAIVALNPDLAADCGVLYAGQALLIPKQAGSQITIVPFRSPTPHLPQVTKISSVDSMEMVFIPSGEFPMGADDTDPDAGPVEKPQHWLYLSPYWIDRTEITNAMYQQCVKAGDCQPPEKLSSKTRPAYYNDAQYQDYPVVFVSWEDASVYCHWAGQRLPSEAEWEKAARGKDSQLYPWGDAQADFRKANFNSLAGDTTRVGLYPAGASPFGVLDMAGNVAEWVADWYSDGYYAASPYKNPPGPKSGEFRMLRGGSWFNTAHALRTTFRLWNYPTLHSETIGFRCAQ
jgi:formylglycine-generating enzyme required for sulfatase activity/serine/threonine protein kinase